MLALGFVCVRGAYKSETAESWFKMGKRDFGAGWTEIKVARVFVDVALH
jgi:hypothetical protein